MELFFEALKGCMTSQVSVLELCSLCFNVPVGKLPGTGRLHALGMISVCVCDCRMGTQILWRQLPEPLEFSRDT